MLEELKDVKIKKHTVTSIEYDCKTEEKEDEVFDQVNNLRKNHCGCGSGSQSKSRN